MWYFISPYYHFSATKEFNFKEIFKQNSSQTTSIRHCILIEGHPGYGKTTLARNIAKDWGAKKDYMQEFKLVIFICCRDLKGRTLKEYVAKTFPKLENSEKSVDLEDWHGQRKGILFILDGLDECNNEDVMTINDLLTAKYFSGASILATTRPLTEDTGINRGQFTKTVSIKGFNQEQIERIIDEHFKGRLGLGEKMKQTLFSGNKAFQQLVSCPLLCQLFCFIFEKDEKFPQKVTGVYFRLIQWLIR